MKITLLCDNPKSWILPYIDHLIELLSGNYDVRFINNVDKIPKGDMLFILGCENKISKSKLKLNNRNLVVHPSKLPRGRGWSPLAWQILEGKNKIPISLFEANEKIDSGKVYLLDYIILKGYELNNEIKSIQGQVTIKMIINFIENYKQLAGKEQFGKPTYYDKRTSNDSELDINKSIIEQFNLLRIVDNERYPAFFHYKGKKFNITIERED